MRLRRQLHFLIGVFFSSTRVSLSSSNLRKTKKKCGYIYFLILNLQIEFVQRALPIRILSVGKKRSPGLQLMVDEYVDKLKYYCSVEDVQIRPNPRNAR